MLIDLHCHVLPGIDDGPKTLDDALALARAAVEAGTSTIVATPHVNHAFPGNDAAGIAAAVTELSAALASAGIPVEVLPGAEVALTRAMELSDDELAGLRLAGGPYLLVECPETPSAVGFEAALGGLQARGNRILLAHVERIPGFQRDIDLVRTLVERGVLVQVTAAAIGGRYGKPVQRFAVELLRAGLVHDVASDAHHAERRGPGMAAYLESAGWGGAVEHLCVRTPRAIVDGSARPEWPASVRVPRTLRRRRWRPVG